MANVQTQFDEFHEAIKLRRFEENKTLREKRDIIRDKLKESLPGVFEAYDEECPNFWFEDQGSYALGTGIKPLKAKEGDFDIDQGLYFGVSTEDYPDPVVLKQRVHEALDGHTKEVRIRRACVTVFYQQDGEPVYHVDLAVFSSGSENGDGKDRLAMGREHSSAEFRSWHVSKPAELNDTLKSKFESTDRAQFRHVVRHLKRWKDENFQADGSAAPRGIGLTVATYDDFIPMYLDLLTGRFNDLGALRHLVRAILGRFTEHWDEDEGRWMRRLKVNLPVEPWNDLFAQMTNRQMERFEAKLKQLQEALDDAHEAVDPVEACERLRDVFGDDFPVPDKEETAAKHAPAIVSSSSNA